MNCFNAKLIIAPLVQIATKKKKEKIEKVQMLSWKAYKHCLAPAMITSFQNTAHLAHLVLKNNIIDLLEEIKKDLYMLHIIQIQ